MPYLSRLNTSVLSVSGVLTRFRTETTHIEKGIQLKLDIMCDHLSSLQWHKLGVI